LVNPSWRDRLRKQASRLDGDSEFVAVPISLGEEDEEYGLQESLDDGGTNR